MVGIGETQISHPQEGVEKSPRSAESRKQRIHRVTVT